MEWTCAAAGISSPNSIPNPQNCDFPIQYVSIFINITSHFQYSSILLNITLAGQLQLAAWSASGLGHRDSGVTRTLTRDWLGLVTPATRRRHSAVTARWTRTELTVTVTIRVTNLPHPARPPPGVPP